MEATEDPIPGDPEEVKPSSEYLEADVPTVNREAELPAVNQEAELPAINREAEVPAVDGEAEVRPPAVNREISMNEFSCSCCFELMVQPTTVTCGHNFCRHCLASWYLTSNKMVCPECRQIWTGLPKVNVVLRSTIHKLFASSIEAREQAVAEDEAAKENVKKFETRLSNVPLPPGAQSHMMWYGVAVALGVMMIINLIWYWSSSDYNLLAHKHVIRWTVDDVIHWLSDLGAWTEEYKDQVKHQNIDGYLLIAINEDNVDDVFNSSSQFHRSAVLNAINIVNTLGVKAPSTLWEYKEIYPGKTLFFTMVKDYPRLVILYEYIFDFEESFVPFIHSICPLDESDASNFITLPPPTIAQWIEFIPKYLFFPYWILSRFAWRWQDIHGLISRVIQINCLLLTIGEASRFKWLITAGRNQGILGPVLRNHLNTFYLIVAVRLFFFLIPTFICDILFYYALSQMFLAVIGAIQAVYAALRRGLGIIM